MGFWLFLTICNLLLPALMIVFGKVFLKKPPDTINEIYGYRTSRSKQNQETWKFAHLYCGKLWWKSGWIMLPSAVIGMLPAIGNNDNVMGALSAVIVIIELLVMFMTIFCVEKALSERFYI